MPGMALLLPVHHHTVPLTDFFRSILKPPDFVSSLKVFRTMGSKRLLSTERNTQGALLHCGGLLFHCLPPCRVGSPSTVVPPISGSPGGLWGPATLPRPVRLEEC